MAFYHSTAPKERHAVPRNNTILPFWWMNTFLNRTATAPGWNSPESATRPFNVDDDEDNGENISTGDDLELGQKNQTDIWENISVLIPANDTYLIDSWTEEPIDAFTDVESGTDAVVTVSPHTQRTAPVYEEIQLTEASRPTRTSATASTEADRLDTTSAGHYFNAAEMKTVDSSGRGVSNFWEEIQLTQPNVQANTNSSNNVTLGHSDSVTQSHSDSVTQSHSDSVTPTSVADMTEGPGQLYHNDGTLERPPDSVTKSGSDVITHSNQSSDAIQNQTDGVAVKQSDSVTRQPYDIDLKTHNHGSTDHSDTITLGDAVTQPPDYDVTYSRGITVRHHGVSESNNDSVTVNPTRDAKTPIPVDQVKKDKSSKKDKKGSSKKLQRTKATDGGPIIIYNDVSIDALHEQLIRRLDSLARKYETNNSSTIL